MHIVKTFCVDFSLIVFATVLAFAIQDNFSVSIERLHAAGPYLFATAVSASAAVPLFGLHRAIWRLSGQRDLERAACAAIVTVAGALAVGFTADRLAGVPRSLPLLQLVLLVGLMLAARVLSRCVHERKGVAFVATPRPTGDGMRSIVLLVGVNSLSELYLRSVAELAQGEVEVAGVLGRGPRQVGRRFQSCKILGEPHELAHVIRTLEVEGVIVDRVAVAVPRHKLSPEVRHALSEIGGAGIAVYYLADRIGLGLSDAAPTMVRENWQALSGPEYSLAELRLLAGRQYLRIKRVLDIAGAAVLLVVAAPLFLAVALLVALDVGAPVVFCQRRPGLRGHPFRLYKFRTMSRAFDTEGNRVDDGARSSGIGRFLRRTRLDELPQLCNVLVGDMSFVGPRPLLPFDQRPEFKARLLVRPGITGWAQIAGGRRLAAADKAAMDVWYVQNTSLRLDLQILLRTLPALFRGDRINAVAIERAWRDLGPTGICSGWAPPADGDGMPRDISSGKLADRPCRAA